MFGVATELLIHKQISFEKGKLKLLSHPILFTPVSTFLGIQKILEKDGKENAIYYGAKETGLTWNQILKKNYRMKSNDILKWGQNVINLAGWGIFKALKTDLKNQEMLWVLEDSTLAKAYKKNSNPVDHTVRGYFAGAASFLLGKDVDAIETECMATGNGKCKFIMRPRERFDLSNPLVKRQLKR